VVYNEIINKTLRIEGITIPGMQETSWV
jgi:hypothetical protein